ncbi:MAG: antibiotic biosynthesis monooxygenase [Proteobacteria bacterium]|nr:antibiotic biosynthesis monooxygenase [Pseudomonadota bacterium]
MHPQSITVVYKWTANPGKLAELRAIYEQVTTAMLEHEPGAVAVQIYVSESDNALYVRDEFADANALGFHLQHTAGPHFPQLLEVARPGTFLFFGDVPEELQQGALQMGLQAEFAQRVTGFDRANP